MIILYKNLIKAGAKSEQSLKVLSLLSSIFCKMGYNNNKCRDYIIRKGGIQIISNSLSTTGVYFGDQQFVYKTLYALGSLAGNIDQELLVWVSGGVSLALEYFERPEFQEPAAFVLWRTCIDAVEVQELLFSNDFPEKALRTLDTFPNTETSTYLIGILRRLCNNPAHKESLSGPASQCFLIWLKELTKQSYMLPLKELAAGLGSLCTKREIAQEVVKAAGIEIFIEIILRHLDQAKLIKTCVGTLVNLSVQGNI